MKLVDKVYQKNPDMVFRKIAGEYILVPIRQNVGDLESIYTLKNEAATRIWELINGKRKVKQIKSLIVKEFKVSSQQAEDDLILFIKQLEAAGGIKGL